MTTRNQSGVAELMIPVTNETLDSAIDKLARMPMGEVVRISEGMVPKIGFPYGSEANAGMFLVSRLFTDAVFHGDIYSIQTIVNRIDGGVPRDSEVDSFESLFGDSVKRVLAADEGSQLKVMPEDTVMDALCKSLYDMAVRDLYRKEDGRPCKPSAEARRERDAARRLIIERTGGRKSKIESEAAPREIEVASWIAELPSGEN